MNRILIISPNYCFAVLFVRPCRNEMWSFSHWGVCIKTKTMQIWSEASVIWKINCRISCSQIKSCKTSFNSESLNAYAPLSVLNDWMVIYLFAIHSIVLCGGGSCSTGPNQSAFPFCILFWARYFLMHSNWTEKNGKNFRVYFYWIYWYFGRCRRCSQTIWTSIYKTKFLSNLIPSSQLPQIVSTDGQLKQSHSSCATPCAPEQCDTVHAYFLLITEESPFSYLT